MSPEELRSASLLFPELASGTVTIAELDRPEVVAAVRGKRVQPLPMRVLDRIRMRRDPDHYLRAWLEPRLAARAAVLGERASGAPRVLVRVDEFPHVCAYADEAHGTEAYRRFHRILAAAGVDYLIAALPRLSRLPYDPDDDTARELDEGELELLRELDTAGVEIAVHGLDHRTRDARPRRHSELIGRSDRDLRSRLERADEILAAIGIRARVFVPPFNRFSADQYPVLAERFEIVGAGPETIMEMGYQQTPQWRDGAIMLPSYAPLYGRAVDVLPAVEALIERGAALWVPVVLHWGWEMEDGFASLRRLCELIAPVTRPWRELLEAGREALQLVPDPADGVAR